MIGNDTLFNTLLFPFRWPNGQWKVVIVAKANFAIRNMNTSTLCSEVSEITLADKYYDDDIKKSIQYASDLVPEKNNLDVVLNGSAYSADNKARKDIPVSLELGRICKKLRVVKISNRRDRIFGLGTGPFDSHGSVELRYENAFGGVDESKNKMFWENPIGCGYRAWRSKKSKKDIDLPRIFYQDSDIHTVNRKTKPAGFGFIGGNWLPRTGFLGTYDHNWEKQGAPHLAQDFDFRYYNSAPVDQQLAKQDIRGQWVHLENVHEKYRSLKFKIAYDYPVLQIGDMRQEMDLDTICFEPNILRYYAVWRTQVPIDDPHNLQLDGLRLEHQF